MDTAIVVYAAGVVDSEGCITITCHQRAGQCGLRYVPQTSVSNSDEDLMGWFIDNFGGTYTKGKSRGSNRKDEYVWHIYGVNELQVFLELIRPFVKVKRQQLELVLYYISLGIGVPGNGHDPELLAARADLYWDMKRLNHT